MLTFRALLLLTFSIVHTLESEPPGGYYTTRYDHIDVENILNQKRLVYYYAECLLDRGPCTPQGIEFKRILPEALKTNCLRCTEKQRFVTLKSIRRLKKEYPEVWAQLAQIWDPTGEYVQNLENSFNKNYNNHSPEQQASNLIPVLPTTTEKLIGTTKTSLTTTTARSTTRLTTKLTTRLTTRVTTTPTPTRPSSTTSKTTAPPTSRTTTTSRTTFSTTTPSKPTQSTSSRLPSTTKKIIYTTSSKPITFLTINLPTTSPNSISDLPAVTIRLPTRKRYNYDFSMTNKPPVQRKVTGINLVLQGVNNIIQPITDIAGRVLNAGTDIAGIVLNAFGVRKAT